MAKQDFDQAIRQYDAAMAEFFEGKPEALNKIYSSKNDITLAPLAGTFISGRKQVTDTAVTNAKKYREGTTTFETLAKYVTPELAYVVQVERMQAKIGGSNAISSLALRVTSIFVREENDWKLIHRHVDNYNP